ncbi:hypothetical protein ACTJJ0_32615 [Chitinophaga sp. 22321]|uniref:Efflux protein, MATE family n=1 Tax=Chitinophaga hostae TaxID=2831022 RepID=A0ABS5J997_9BACT|nr:hypothetical protein [Chitinophaga hostae]MBS0031781.1 hypothetical protein [Chitinophaga hostae]
MIHIHAAMIGKLVKTAIPLSFGGLAITFLAIMDGIFVYRYAAAAYEAIVLSIPLISVVSGISAAIAVAIANGVSRSSDESTLFREIYVVFIIALILAIAVFLLSNGLTDRIIGYYRIGEVPTGGYFRIYWRNMISAFVLQVYFSLLVQFITSIGKIRQANIALLVMLGVNLLVNPLLIFMMGYGIKGAAIATNLSYLAGFLVIFGIWLWPARSTFYRLCRFGKCMVHNRLLQVTVKAQVTDVVSVFISSMVFTIRSVLFTKLALGQGPLAITVFGIAEQLKNICIMPVRGVVSAYLVEFGKLLSQRNIAGYATVYWQATIITGVVHFGIGLLFVLTSGYIADIYGITDVSARNLLRYFIFYTFLILLVEILPRCAQFGFLSVGKPGIFISHSIVTVTLSYAFMMAAMKYQPVEGLMTGQLSGILLTSVIFVFIFFRILKKLSRQPDIRLAGSG